MRRHVLALAVALLPLPVLAQEDDRSYLTAFLEDNLSGAGRQVTVTGFAGALSSRATIQELTIADDQGVWLTLRDVALDWNRAALFRGEISVNELSAAEIEVARLPVSEDAAPSPEAGSFSLPELPVSVTVSKLAAARIVLGAGVLGQPVEGQLEASAVLAGGEGDALLRLERTDSGPDGSVALKASYSNFGRRLAIDLSASEGQGGIAATLLGLPGQPAAALEIKGDGPFSKFAADVALSTDGVKRLAGQITLEEGAEATGFAARLSGDLAPLFLPDYAEFFGDAVALDLTGQRHADGRLDLSRLSVSARALALSGALALAPDGLPRSFDLSGRIGRDDGQPVLLPLTTDLPVRIDSADLSVAFDATKGEGWRLSADVLGLDRADFRAARLALIGSGRITRTTAGRQVGATLRFDAEGLSPTDPALARALGSILSGDALMIWREADGVLSVPRLRIGGDGYQAEAGGTIAGLSADLAISGKASAVIDDMARLSGLAGRPLGGSGQVTLTGTASPLTGAFDVVAEVRGRDLSAGIAEVDGLLRGESTVGLSARRDQAGTTLRSLTIAATSLKAEATGTLESTGSDLTARLDFSDLSVLGGRYGGALRGDARLTGTLADARITLDATARNLRVGQAEADKLIRGDSALTLRLALTEGDIRVEEARLTNTQLTASATGAINAGTQQLDVTARLANLGLLLPEFPGPLTVSGTVTQDAQGVGLNLTGTGPGGIDARVTGQLAPDFSRGDLALNGRAQAALANAFISPRAVQGGLGFDLRMNGPLALSSLTGSVTLSDGRVSDPALKFALQNIAARADLAGGRANLSATLPVSTGGQLEVQGTVGTAAPYSADLGLGLRQVALRDPELYETTISGDLTVSGPLTGGARISGRLALGETELRVPSTGFGGAGGIEDLRHFYEPADVRATRGRAGLLGQKADGSLRSGQGVYGLDVSISAPNQVFLRGRGLDAELGGELRLLGTTAAVVPSGAFDLIRGRLDILGKRLDLTEARLQMEGELVPDIHIVASTENDGITTGITIDGPATSPTVSFTSSPDMPDEEILAQLLFGQNLRNLSAFQALQLASAVATLAGRGGEGIVGRLRQGFGLDNLDVKTSATGAAEVTAGKYLGKNLYSEVTIGQDGKSQINLNLDVSKSITLRGRASSDGTAGIGVYLEKDY